MEVYVDESEKCIHLIFNDKKIMKDTLQHISWKREAIREDKKIYDAHNLPLKFLKECIRNENISLSIDENIKKKMENLLIFGDEYYVIGYIKGDTLAKNHELCHAKYHRDKKYRENIKAFWDSIPKKKREQIRESLFRMGYKEEFHLDEFQAYFYSGSQKKDHNYWGI